MSSGGTSVSEELDQPFVIHTLNSYTHMGLSVLAEHLDLKSNHLQAIIRAEHRNLVMKLADVGVDYAELGNALVPKARRHEVAFIFDSTQTENGAYGYSLAERWIPVVKAHGPEKTVMRVGDILGLPNEFVWGELSGRMVGPASFPRLACELYFVVYLTNLSPIQVRDIDQALRLATGAFLGHVDCSTWNPLKMGLFLPQVGLRLRDQILTDTDDVGTPNLPGYPFEESGFLVVGVPDELYGLFLGHRLDNGVPSWADQDSSIALTVLGGDLSPATSSSVIINEARISYLERDHRTSLSRAQLDNLDKHALAEAIKRKLANGLIYNLRFIQGVRGGVPMAELDALMYSVQVEFPDHSGDVRRYQVGLKYTPATHASEVTTFF